MGMMKIFSLMTFFHQLVLRAGIVGTAASLIPHFVINKF